MSNGIVISQQGIDLKRAAEYQKVLDSRWRFLEIEKEIVLTIDTNAIIRVVDHNLGYLPFFTTVYPDSSLSRHGLTRATSRSVYIDTRFETIPFTICVRVFRVDVTSNYTAPVDFQIAAQESEKTPYGVKVLKRDSGRGMDEKNKDFYSLNTRAKALSIHSHGSASASGGQITLQPALGYPPSYFLASTTTVSSGEEAGAPAVSEFDALNCVASANAATITFSGAQSALSGSYAYLILKDPAQVAR